MTKRAYFRMYSLLSLGNVFLNVLGYSMHKFDKVPCHFSQIQMKLSLDVDAYRLQSNHLLSGQCGTNNSTLNMWSWSMNIAYKPIDLLLADSL